MHVRNDKDSYRSERGYMLVLNALMASMMAMFIALGINGFIIVTARLQQRNTAEFVAMTILHQQTTNPSQYDYLKVKAGLEVGRTHVVGLQDESLLTEGDLVLGQNVEFGTLSPVGAFIPEGGLPGARTAIRVSLEIKQGSMMMMALGLFGMDDHPLFKSSVVVAYQASANPNHQRYFVVG